MEIAMPKCYFAEFHNTKTNHTFQKFGHTGKNDVMIRLNYIKEEHPHFDVRVLAAAYHHDIEKCKGAEEAFKSMYPKNIMITEKISGVTEIYQCPDRDVRFKIIQAFRRLNDKFKRECFSTSISTPTNEKGYPSYEAVNS